MYQFTTDQQNVVLATMLQVFPHVHLFRTGFDTKMPVLALVGFRDGDLNWQSIAARCACLRTSSVSDPYVRHWQSVGMLYLGSAATPLPRRTERINTLGNAWIELSAGHDFVIGRWQQEGFANDRRWVQLTEQIKGCSTFPADSPELERLSRLGDLATRWDWLSKTEPQQAGRLMEQMRRDFPASLLHDDSATWSSWRGWRVLRGQTLRAARVVESRSK
jgi:hypothetical protein